MVGRWRLNAANRFPAQSAAREFTIDRHEAYFAESRVLQEAITLLRGYMSASARREGIAAGQMDEPGDLQ
jgi:hypothetical protein